MDTTTQQNIIAGLLAAHGTEEGALLPLLHDIQREIGFIPPESIADIAKALNLSAAEVQGVISYYHLFRTEKPGRHTVQVCQAEACRACGAEALMVHAEQTLGCGSGQTRADGAFTLTPVFCLGLCASSPAVQVDDHPHARVTPEQFQTIIAVLEPAS